MIPTKTTSEADKPTRSSAHHSGTAILGWDNVGTWMDRRVMKEARLLTGVERRSFLRPETATHRVEYRLFFALRELLWEWRRWHMHGVWRGGAVDAIITSDGWIVELSVQLKTASMPEQYERGRSWLAVGIKIEAAVEPPRDMFVAVWRDHTEIQPVFAVMLSTARLQEAKTTKQSYVLRFHTVGWKAPSWLQGRAGRGWRTTFPRSAPLI